jgi:hypothetical protein
MSARRLAVVIDEKNANQKPCEVGWTREFEAGIYG